MRSMFTCTCVRVSVVRVLGARCFSPAKTFSSCGRWPFSCSHMFG
jgi:hypothetical protein